MKKFCLVIVTLCLCLPVFGKGVDLDKMSERRRSNYLVRETKKIVMRYGPGYYRDIKPPIIERYLTLEKESVLHNQKELDNIGRAYYLVKYPYDDNIETFLLDFSVQVFFWADNGAPIMVMFGAGWYFDLEDPITGTPEDTRFFEYEKKPPLEQR